MFSYVQFYSVSEVFVLRHTMLCCYVLKQSYTVLVSSLEYGQNTTCVSIVSPLVIVILTFPFLGMYL